MSRSLKFAMVLATGLAASALPVLASEEVDNGFFLPDIFSAMEHSKKPFLDLKKAPYAGEKFEPPFHLHQLVCDTTGRTILTIGIEFAISSSDVEKMKIDPSEFIPQYLPSFFDSISLSWENASKKHPFDPKDLDSINSPMAKSALKGIQEVTGWIKSDSGITVAVAGKIEKATPLTGANTPSCR